MAQDQRVPIRGTELKPRAGERWRPASDLSPHITVTIVLRRAAGGPSDDELLSGGYHPQGQGGAAQAVAADPSDMGVARAFATEYGLKVVEQDAAARRLRVQGTLAQMQAAFGVQLGNSEDSQGHSYLTYQGSISIPLALSGIVTAVLGLDERPVARHAGG